MAHKSRQALRPGTAGLHHNEKLPPPLDCLAFGVTKEKEHLSPKQTAGEASAAAVAAHERVPTHRTLHLDEGERPHGDLTGALHLEAGLLVEGHEEVLAHEDGPAHVGEAAQVLQVPPHQDRSFALLAEGAVDRQDVNVDRGAVRLVEGQGVLKRDTKNGMDPFFSLCDKEDINVL
ncbi:hypothetical protein AOLI_G00003520 [Acnodon oligacanthus]